MVMIHGTTLTIAIGSCGNIFRKHALFCQVSKLARAEVLLSDTKFIYHTFQEN
jgi:hypothetical protein